MERREWPHEKQPRASDYATLIRTTELPESHVRVLFENIRICFTSMVSQRCRRVVEEG